jgi:hypothetical protein
MHAAVSVAASRPRGEKHDTPGEFVTTTAAEAKATITTGSRADANDRLAAGFSKERNDSTLSLSQHARKSLALALAHGALDIESSETRSIPMREGANTFPIKQRAGSRDGASEHGDADDICDVAARLIDCGRKHSVVEA